MNGAHSTRLQEARRLRSHGDAVAFYVKRRVEDTGRQPEEWSEAQRCGFKADMDLWRSTLFLGTRTDAIRQTAYRHRRPLPTTENEALLFVAWATAIGEPGFDPPPPERSKRPPPPGPSEPPPLSKKLRNAQLFAWMEEEWRDGENQRQAAQRVRRRLQASGHRDISEGSIQARYHEQKRRIAAINDEISNELGSYLTEDGVTPELAMLVAMVRENQLTPMERAALAMVNPRWLQIAPWEGESIEPPKYSYKPELAMLAALVKSQPTPAAFATTNPEGLQIAPWSNGETLKHSYNFSLKFGSVL